MNELLAALVAAAKVGFDAPKCGRCFGKGFNAGCCEERRRHGVCYCSPRPPCPHCHATGLDASDPERLIGRAMVWLHERDALALERQRQPAVDACVRFGPIELWKERETHDGTPTGLATALLRLVARVGGEA